MKENVSIITDGKSVGFSSKETSIVLSFQYNLFICDFDDTYQDQLIEKLYSFKTDEAYDIIQLLRIIAAFLESHNVDTQNSELISSFLYYIIIMSQHKERDVKFYAIKCLIELTKFDYIQRLALMHLSQVMDTGSETIKIAILKRISKIRTDDNAYITHIVNQGKADNNCFVRYVAENECDSIAE